MYPWAVVFAAEGAIALMEMLMFIAILLLGILYAWREGAPSRAFDFRRQPGRGPCLPVVGAGMGGGRGSVAASRRRMVETPSPPPSSS